MTRLLAVLFFCLAVAVARDSGGDVAKGSKPSRSPDSLPVGKWNVAFINGVRQVCEISDAKLGQATVAEPSRTSEGMVSQADGSLLMTFNDDRIERWTPARGRFLVEHWFPAAGYPRAEPVLGIAEPAR